MTKALLFDLDGTLLNTISFTYDTYSHVFNLIGLPQIEKSKIAKIVSLPLEQGYKSLIGSNTTSIEQIIDTHRKFQKENLYKIKPYENTVSTLDVLRQREFKMAIVTTRIYNVSHLLKQAEIYSYFPVIIKGDDVINYKPHPEAIYLALEKIGIDTKEAMIIGDSGADIEAGKKSGIKTIAVASGFTPREILRQYHPDFLVDDISEVLKIL